MTTTGPDLTAWDETVPIDAIRPYPHNPRHGDTDIIAESIRTNGLYRRLIVSQDGVILAGNHTYQALHELGYQQVPITRLPIHSESDAAVKVVLADNRSSDAATYDQVELAALLRTLDADLYGTGYTDDDLDDLLAKIQEDALRPLDLSTVGRDPSLADKLDRYQAMGRRMIVLDYDQDTYASVTAMLAQARQKYGHDTNADTVLAMLADVTGGQIG